MWYRLILLGLLMLFVHTSCIPSQYAITDKKNNANESSFTLRGAIPNTYTAGNDKCKPDHNCNFHQGTGYSWCYVIRGGWFFCCIATCEAIQMPHNGYISNLCGTGDRAVYCGGGSTTIYGKQCLPSHPCGQHSLTEYDQYYWCNTEENGNWDYCCNPFDFCGSKGYKYNWCYTNTPLHSTTSWEYCKPQGNNTQPSITNLIVIEI